MKQPIYKYLADEQFVQWVLSKKTSTDLDAYWRGYIASNPKQKKDIEAAQDFIQKLQFNTQFSEDRLKHEIWKEIQQNKYSSRNTLESKKVKFFNYRNLRRIAASIAFLACLTLLFEEVLMPSKNLENAFFSWKTIKTASGERVKKILPDGSLVWLNAGSVLKYSIQKSDNERLVELEGEGYFEVTKSTKLFKVKTGKLITSVLGTKFNINSYKKEIQIGLLEGEVKVNSPNGELLLKPEEMALYKSLESNDLSKVKFNKEDIISWTKGKLIFKNSSFIETINKIEQWYGVKFAYKNEIQTLNWSYTGHFKNKELDVVLRSIFYYNGYSYQIIDNKILLNKK